MHKQLIALATFLATSVVAQGPGDYTKEVHPDLPIQTCTRKGCRSLKTKVVLDSNYRWLHSKGGYAPCVMGGNFSPEYCPNATACAANCVLEGVNYEAFGIKTEGNSLSLNLFVDNGTSFAAPRVYLLSEDEHKYYKFRLLNREFTYDVDVSQVPCGVNGALYFTEMSANGEQNSYNSAGAYYGTGYCDSKCPKQNFIGGKANYDFKYGACCNEVGIWEANSASNVFTPRPCKARGLYKCQGADCGHDDDKAKGICDTDSCDFNPYRLENRDYYGPGKTVNTNKKFTVVTQFRTKGNQDRGELLEVRRLYVQDGKVIGNAHVNVPNFDTKFDSVTDEYCTKEAEVFGSETTYVARGGTKQIGQAIERGVVLALSINWDQVGHLKWLDGILEDGSGPGQNRGPCKADVGDPTWIERLHSDTKVTFSNIKIGEFGSTY